MLKITSFSALSVGLLLSMPLLFTDAEAGRVQVLDISAKTDREPITESPGDRLADAFGAFGSCSVYNKGDDTSSQCSLAISSGTLEVRDVTQQTTTLASVSSR